MFSQKARQTSSNNITKKKFIFVLKIKDLQTNTKLFSFYTIISLCRVIFRDLEQFSLYIVYLYQQKISQSDAIDLRSVDIYVSNEKFLFTEKVLIIILSDKMQLSHTFRIHSLTLIMSHYKQTNMYKPKNNNDPEETCLNEEILRISYKY
jgi:hypothetical protein